MAAVACAVCLLPVPPVLAQLAGAPLGVPASAAPPPPDYAPYEALRWKGLEVDLPAPADTVDRLAGGFRERLAALGIGYLGVSLQNYADNTLPVARSSNGHQTYSGQRPTYFSQNFLLVTYDAGRVGLNGGQFVVGGSRSYYTWKQGGPDTFGLLTLSYYQPLFGGRVEVKAGYLVNVFEFANTYVGGTLAQGTFGQSGNPLLQAGLSGGGVTAPGIEATLHLTEQAYTRLAVERPISPDGTIVDAQQNRTSLDLRVPNTGVLVIDESGYRVAASPGWHETWVRGALAANSSRLRDYAGPANARAAGADTLAYLLADRQLVQLDPAGRPTRGVYVGASAYYAPPEFNRFSQLYQGRLYAKGLFAARPVDQVSLVASYNVFSGTLYSQALAAGQPAHRASLTLTASYGLHLADGLYLNLGLAYTDHPTSITYTPQTGSALNALVNASLFF